MFPPLLQKLWSLAPQAFLMLFVLSACSLNPPVQEMSNARQTLQAAYEANAEQYAPATLKEAERLLEQATSALESRDYQAARNFAISAQQQAIKARQQAVSKQKPD
jgi:predicted S18 family serine protease